MSKLLEAHEALQDRKAASGMAEFRDVIRGAAPTPYADEHTGMLAGTDLLEEELGQLAEHFAAAAMVMIYVQGIDPTATIAGIYREGILTGIEYARRAELT